jgi:hypothetical protein
MPKLIRMRFRDKPTALLSSREQIEQARQEVEACEERFKPFEREPFDPGSEALRLWEELTAARKKLSGLRFIFEDHAPCVLLSDQLKALNQCHEDFYRRTV